jgi:hypothetical protein
VASTAPRNAERPPGMNRRLAGALVASTVALGACALTGSTYPEIDADLSELRLFPVAESAPAPPVSVEEAVQTARDRHDEPIEVLRVGRRIDPESRSLWVVIFRPSDSDRAACECEWTALTIDDHTGRIHAGFDDLSWRAFQLPRPPWE